jgi:hypothetical protein
LGGAALGFYAEWGRSHLAKVLALPGVLLDHPMTLDRNGARG